MRFSSRPERFSVPDPFATVRNGAFLPFVAYHRLMNRRELLQAPLLFALPRPCCQLDDLQPPTYQLDANSLTIDLRQARELDRVGGAMKLVDAGRGLHLFVAQTERRVFHAWTTVCTHGGAPLVYNHRHRSALCTSVGHSEFDIEGRVVRGSAPRPVTTYKTNLKGHLLRVLLAALTAMAAFAQPRPVYVDIPAGALPAFSMARTETTVAQFRAFTRATGYRTYAETTGQRRTWLDPGFKASARQPVVYVTAADGAAYCQWVGARLPSEAEWDVANRAGSPTLHPWGDGVDARFLWYRENSQGRLRPVATRRPNAFGLHDTEGSVWEHTLAPEGHSVLRGGSWMDCPAISPWAAERPIYRRPLAGAPNHRDDDIGFRCARSAVLP